MAILKGKDLISKESNRVASVAEGTKIARELLKKLSHHNKHFYTSGIGLSAPQIGIFKRVAVILDSPPILLINPSIVEHSNGKIPFEEGCLSFPGQKVITKRWIWVSVMSDNFLEPRIFGPKYSKNWTDRDILFSVCVQHELDHLDGILMFSRRGDV